MGFVGQMSSHNPRDPAINFLGPTDPPDKQNRGFWSVFKLSITETCGYGLQQTWQFNLTGFGLGNDRGEIPSSVLQARKNNLVTKKGTFSKAFATLFALRNLNH